MDLKAPYFNIWITASLLIFSIHANSSEFTKSIAGKLPRNGIALPEIPCPADPSNCAGADDLQLSTTATLCAPPSKTPQDELTSVNIESCSYLLEGTFGGIYAVTVFFENGGVIAVHLSQLDTEL